jgi:hypothetical protein
VFAENKIEMSFVRFFFEQISAAVENYSQKKKLVDVSEQTMSG